MSRHRLDPPARVNPRLGRMAAAGFSVVVTALALLGGLGVIPVPSHAVATEAKLSAHHGAPATSAPATPTTTPTTKPSVKAKTSTSSSTSSSRTTVTSATALPADTGTGKRIVFDMSDQRVWLVDPDGAVRTTYLVSGSLTHNLNPGTYAVYSKSRWAVGVDDSGVMQYFVRFTRGNNAAIGFHSIPTQNGKPLQTVAQLGTPQSHGCIRQYLPNAIKLWDFAPVGTKVVVTA